MIKHAAFVLASLVVATSARAEPAQRCIAANESAIAHRTKLELAAARKDLEVCSAADCPSEISSECTRRLAELATAMPTIVFAVKDPSGADLTDVTVTMDDRTFAAPLGVGALDVDPGTHTFEIVAPGRPAVRKTLVVREGEKDRHELVTLESEQIVERPRGGGVRTAGFVVGSIGLVGVVIGGVFGVLTIAKNDLANQSCPNDNCSPTGVQAGKDAYTFATVSTAAFAIGLGCVAAGVVMILVGGPHRAASARVEISPTGLLLRGTF